MRTTINKGRVAYAPASLDGHTPDQVTNPRGFTSYRQSVDGPKVRERSPSFDDHYGQASLFWNSMSPPEKEHIMKSLSFELSKVETREVRQRMLGHLRRINETLAAQVGHSIGERPTDVEVSGSADSIAETRMLADATTPTTASAGVQKSKALSMEDQPTSPKGRMVAILLDSSVDMDAVGATEEALKAAGAHTELVGPYLGAMGATKTYANTASVLYDAVVVPGGASSLAMRGDAKAFVAQAYKHGKPILALGDGKSVLKAALPEGATMGEKGIVTDLDLFVSSVGGRFWGRAALEKLAA